MKIESPEAQAPRTRGCDPRRDRRPRLSRVLQAAVDGLNEAVRVFCSTLREIFDESAYARFLDRQHTVNSRQAYAAFLHENQRQRERRPRCC